MNWDPDFLARSPMFEPLRVHAPAFPTRWPGLAELQQQFERRRPPLRSASGAPINLVPQARKPRTLQDRYEARIFLKGEVQMRARDWHDLFNLLVWLAFPCAKAALNERHYRALLAQQASGAANRGPQQDALTLFDEGGVVVASADADLLDLVRDFHWRKLFWDCRQRVLARTRFYLFGHALYEKALHPFAGVTGRAVLLRVDLQLLTLPLAAQLSALDVQLAAYLSDPGRLASPRELAPLPVLGVPGWCAANERADYYDDQNYFRAGRHP